MNDHVPRPELDAKLQLIEQRVETSIVRIEGKIDAALIEIRSASKQQESALSRIQADHGELKQALANAKYWAIGTALAVLGLFVNFRMNDNDWIRSSLDGLRGDIKAWQGTGVGQASASGPLTTKPGGPEIPKQPPAPAPKQ